MKPSEKIQALASGKHEELMAGYRQCDPATLPAALRFLDAELVFLRRVVLALVVVDVLGGAGVAWHALF